MKRNTIILTSAFIMLVAASVWAWGGKATGCITNLKVSPATASVQGTTEGGSLWLAYTVRWKDGREEDYKPVKVKGKFSKNLSYQLRPQGLDEVIVCLWQDKVLRKECEKKNGQACQYCRKNGFHMEGRVDRKSGS